ncbi:hypothetical protein [Streptomyces sp. NPDC001292]|uniref:hypothetical protein n=1 Tax=Streptomyces sp. NPDC001292 TaxID=3364558 RepID=UPI0036C9B6EB
MRSTHQALDEARASLTGLKAPSATRQGSTPPPPDTGARAGFTAREHQGRTLYLLPPETAADAHERAGVAAYGLMAHTLDLVDLAWTTRQHGTSATERPGVTVCLTDHSVTATAATDQAAAVLAQHGFTPAGGEAAVRAATGAR